jgi:hypothetical protein
VSRRAAFAIKTSSNRRNSATERQRSTCRRSPSLSYNGQVGAIRFTHAHNQKPIIPNFFVQKVRRPAVTVAVLRFARVVLASWRLWGMLTANNPSSFTTLSSAILLFRSSSSEDRRALGQSSVSHRFVTSSLRRWKLMAETKTAIRLSESAFVTKSRPHRAQWCWMTVCPDSMTTGRGLASQRCVFCVFQISSLNFMPTPKNMNDRCCQVQVKIDHHRLDGVQVARDFHKEQLDVERMRRASASSHTVLPRGKQWVWPRRFMRRLDELLKR